MVFLKNLLLNVFMWNQIWFFYGFAWRTFWSTFIFKSVLLFFTVFLIKEMQP